MAKQKYLLWFEQTISPKAEKKVKKELKKMGIKAGIVHGVKPPSVISI